MSSGWRCLGQSSRKRGPNNISPGPPEASSLCAANSEYRYITVRPIILSKKQRAIKEQSARR